MNTELSQKEVGIRIMELRKVKGYSQKDLAALVRISRSSVAQVELGNRKVSIIELMLLSRHLGFSIDRFLARDFNLEEELDQTIEVKREEKTMRISIPRLKVSKFKNILLYILERCAGKPNVGETVLYKLLYFSDFNYYELYEEHLTGAEYRKLPYGPVPQKLNSIINKMIEDAALKRVKTNFHGYPQTRYLPLEKPDLKQLGASEVEVVDNVINQLSDYYAASLSEYSHEDIPWKATKEGDVIDYELAFYRDKPYSVRNYDIDEE